MLGQRTTFGVGPIATRQGRAFVRDVLAGPNLPPERVADAMLVASELISNAVRHAEPGEAIDVAVGLDGDRLRVEVSPVHRESDLSFVVIDGVARAWGVDGRTGWADLRATRGPVSDVRPATSTWSPR
jgi:hypothetical protein